MSELLTPRWTPMRDHAERKRMRLSKARFKVVPAGRRSGKTEDEKRKTVLAAIAAPGDPWYSSFPDPRYFLGAPTYAQAKRIYWEDLKKLSPRRFVEHISESELTIRYKVGSMIQIVGLDKPERIEGSPWDGGVLDEFGNMKKTAWNANVRPALADRRGWCDLIGVPEGRNHYYDLAMDAKARMLDGDPDWAFFTWHSSLILPIEEIESARRDLDELTFQQEYEASFVNFSGRAYHAFGDHNQAAVEYDPRARLIFCFDFNVDPGVAVVAQLRNVGSMPGVVIVGEVHIPNNSNTPAVCRRLLLDWGKHQGSVYAYGDATGGARGTAQTEGSDWDIIRRTMRDHYKDRFVMKVPSSNPTERARVNAMNSLCKSSAGVVRLLVDPKKAPNLTRDLEGVRVLEGGSGEIDKEHDKKLTHLSDALGYLVEAEFPISGTRVAGAARVSGT